MQSSCAVISHPALSPADPHPDVLGGPAQCLLVMLRHSPPSLNVQPLAAPGDTHSDDSRVLTLSSAVAFRTGVSKIAMCLI